MEIKCVKPHGTSLFKLGLWRTDNVSRLWKPVSQSEFYPRGVEESACSIATQSVSAPDCNKGIPTRLASEKAWPSLAENDTR